MPENNGNKYVNLRIFISSIILMIGLIGILYTMICNIDNLAQENRSQISGINANLENIIKSVDEVKVILRENK